MAGGGLAVGVAGLGTSGGGRVTAREPEANLVSGVAGAEKRNGVFTGVLCATEDITVEAVDSGEGS